MSVRKGSRVKFKVGKNWCLGKVLKVAEGKATIETAKGSQVTRALDSLRDPNEDEESAPAPAVALAEVDDEDDGVDPLNDDGDIEDE
jgi:hypothetical protein